MSQARLDEFMIKVRAAATAAKRDFTKSRSCLKDLIDLMEQQIRATRFDVAALGPAITKARADKRGAKYEAALKYVENTWGKPELEYKGPNQAAFTPLIGRLYVHKGTAVTFRQIGTTNQQAITFNDTSSANNDGGEKRPNVTFAGRNIPVRAIVYELRAKLTFADNFPSRSTTDVGVDERLELDFETTPAGITAPNLGGILWSVGAAADASLQRRQFGLMCKTSGDTNPPDPNGKAYYIAPYTTDNAFALGPRTNLKTRDVTLTLEIQDGPSKGTKVEQDLKVHTPIARMVKTAQELHKNGKPSAGFIGEVYFDPKTVSFHTLLWREGRGTFVAKQTAHLASRTEAFGAAPRPLPNSPSGYFAFETGKVHESTIVTSGSAIDISTGSIATGCKMNGTDRVWTGWNDLYPAPYDGTTFPKVRAGLPTNAPSAMDWRINWAYKPDDLPDTEYVIFQQANHQATMDAQGTVTIKKAGAETTKRIGDGDQWA